MTDEEAWKRALDTFGVTVTLEKRLFWDSNTGPKVRYYVELPLPGHTGAYIVAGQSWEEALERAERLKRKRE